MPVQLTCANCQKQFETKPYRAHIPYCCGKCRSEHLQKKVSIECDHCKTVFQEWKSQTRGGKTRFCSMACRRAAMAPKPKPEKAKKEKVIKVCKTCDLEFRVPLTRKSSAIYCSRTCQYADPDYLDAMSIRQRGDKSHSWNGGQGCVTHDGYLAKPDGYGEAKITTFAHRLVMAKLIHSVQPDHPFLVEIGGVVRIRPEIHVHHIDRNKLNNDLSNLLAITASAHIKLHRNGRKPEPWECWPSNPTRW